MPVTTEHGRDATTSQAALRDRLKIVHLTAPASYGGLERVLSALACGHSHAGHEVHVIAVLEPGATPPASWAGDFDRAGVQLHALEVGRREYAHERNRVECITRELEADIAHSHGYRADVVAGPAAARAGAMLVSTVHGFTAAGWRGRLYERVQRRALRGFDAVVAVSRALRDELEHSGIHADRLHVVQNGWDGTSPELDRMRARRELGVAEDAFLVGWVGRLSREKGCDIALAAMAQLPDRHVTLSVIGDGPERARLQTQAVRAGLADRVHWHGALAGAGRLFRAFDVLLLSSRTEGTPIVLLEAMAAGIPIVATRVGGVPDVVSPDEALIVAPAPLTVAAALSAVQRDPDAARGRAHRAGSRLFADFSTVPWLQRYEQLYGTLLERARK